jgi:hypothetical protein
LGNRDEKEEATYQTQRNCSIFPTTLVPGFRQWPELRDGGYPPTNFPEEPKIILAKYFVDAI